MKNRMIFGSLIILLIFSISSFGQIPKILLLVPEDNPDYLVSDMIFNIEAGAMVRMLEDAGYEVDVATGSGQRLTAGQNSFMPEYRFTEINVDDYVGLILPSVRASKREKYSEGATDIIRQIHMQRKPIAAQAYGIVWLGEAGVLSGKKFSFVSANVNSIRLKNRLKDGVLIGNRPIVKDGNIITSGVCPDTSRKFNLPDGTEWLTKALIKELTFN